MAGDMAPEAAPLPGEEACAALVRETDRDRFLATLFAPAAARGGLLALYAFNAEVASVRERVSQPLPGEMRLQWWRDLLEGGAAGEAAGHPVAAALLATVERYRLPRQALLDLLEARIFDLYDDPLPGVGDLEAYAGATSSALIRLAAIILMSGEEPGGADAAGHAGVAYAVAGLLRALPIHASRGQLFIPADLMARHGADRDDVLSGRATPAVRAALADMRRLARSHLDQANAALGAVKPPALAAFLPLALVDPYLAAIERLEARGADPFRTLAELPQWRRQWALWRGARRLARLARG